MEGHYPCPLEACLLEENRHTWCCCSDAESFNRDRRDEDSRDERDQGIREASREMTFVLSIDDQVGICCTE